MINLKLTEIPYKDFYDYKISAIFESYKWDFTHSIQSTISNKVVLLTKNQLDLLKSTSIKLYNETILMEQALKNKINLAIKMGISKKIANKISNCEYNPKKHVRFMRFDFHPTTEGFKISEVNSDVPAGYPEASVLPILAHKYFNDYIPTENFGNIFTNALLSKTIKFGKIVYLHDTSCLEDYQILKFIGDLMDKKNYTSSYLHPNLLNNKLKNNRDIVAIVRYFPVEWLEFEKTDFNIFFDPNIVQANHPICLLTQSKRLPIVWNNLDIDIPTWKSFLMPTKEIDDEILKNNNYILKPSFGRIGEGINIDVSLDEDKKIKKAARSFKNQWIMQKMFTSVPTDGLHITLGVFVVDGVFAGMYARTSKTPKIDKTASEIPVLVSKL
ncbi:MAG: glutathionylspermidine synthase family protein [Defluviitaleaceae bacterium]|nr:glutathionylspermidine synthase family protein [Defluviitaleaceae bacterium]